MKTRHFIMALAAAFMLLPAQSCSLQEDDVFDASSSARLQNYLDEVADILKDGDGTWYFDYYAGTDKSYGGYAYVLKFDGSKVVAASELDPEQTYTSLYKLTTDNGPVLTFDTNNDVLHYFATPSSDLYEAMNGDFEYTIMKYSKEEIILRGKRSSNKYILRPYDSELAPLEYVSKVSTLIEEFRAPSFEGTIGDGVVSGNVDINNRWITFIYGEGEEDYMEVPFVFTADGMRFYEPIKINGCTIKNLWYIQNNNLLTNGVFVLNGKLPDDYQPYDAFAGDFTLCYYKGSRSYNVTLTPNEDRSGYIMSGINENYTVSLKYDKGLGRLRWNAQKIGANGNNVVFLCAWSLAGGGSLTWNTDAGVTIHWVEANDRFEFSDNGGWDSPVDSFILWELDSDGKSVGQFTGWGASQIAYLQYMKRR